MNIVVVAWIKNQPAQGEREKRPLLYQYSSKDFFLLSIRLPQTADTLNPMELRIKSVIGFGGKVQNALKYTPCGGYMVFPLGSFVVIRNVKVTSPSNYRTYS